MRYIISIGLLLAVGTVFVLSCIKYKDTKATPDPRLTNPYCNDPNAVNYNWGFPGKPDSTVCFYPTDVFSGTWEYHDSVFVQPSGLFIYADSFVMTITKLSRTKMTVSGFCGGGGSLTLTAGLLFIATVDTTIGDSLLNATINADEGQPFCMPQDTVNGTFTKNIISDSMMSIVLTVNSDTGVISTHIGTAYKK
jgi:hypothetical protein